MPPAASRKRRAVQDHDVGEPSPEPATQRRRSNLPSGDEADEGYGAANRSKLSEADLREMVKKMVRMALACEYARRPIRRQEISEKVLGSAGRQFRKVFEETQVQLRMVFGMELVALPPKENITAREKRAAQQKSGNQTKVVTSWALQSRLPSHFWNQEVDVVFPPAAPTVEEDTKYIGLCTLLVSLLLLYGGTLSDAKMARYLRRLGLEDRTPLRGFEEPDKLIKRMERDGYLQRGKEGVKDLGEEEWIWGVGPRGRIEIGDEGAKGLALAVYGDLPEAADADLRRRIEKSLALNDRPAPVQADGGGEKKKPGRKPGKKRKSDARNSNEEEEDDDDDTRNDTDDGDEDED